MDLCKAQPFPTPCSGLLADLPSRFPPPTRQSSAFHPDPGARCEGQQGQFPTGQREPGAKWDSQAAPRYPTQSSTGGDQGQPAVPVSTEVHSDEAGPSKSWEVNQHVRVWIIPGTRHRHGSNQSRGGSLACSCCLVLEPGSAIQLVMEK